MTSEVSIGRRERAPEPAVETEYNVQAVAARIDDLYERLAAPRRPGRIVARLSVRSHGHRAVTRPEIGTATTAQPEPGSANANRPGSFDIRDRRLESLYANGTTNGVAADYPGAILDGRLGQQDPCHEQNGCAQDDERACPRPRRLGPAFDDGYADSR